MQRPEHGIDEPRRTPAGNLSGEVYDDDVVDARLRRSSFRCSGEARRRLIWSNH